jgi:hypothetical protein
MKALIVKMSLFSAGCLLLLAASATPAFAVTATPEIDPGSLGSAVTLLAGGYLVLRSKIGRK